MSETCSTCRYQAEHAPSGDRADDLFRVECHRYAPRQAGLYHAWPLVKPEDWCGEWAMTRDAEQALHAEIRRQEADRAPF